MTNQEINTAIAKALPWGCGRDFCSDLNAMHEAEKTIPPIRIRRYISELWAAMCEGGHAEEMDIGTIHATAAQRAEAFLRTLGKWEE